MDLPMGPIKLSELANKWNKTVSDIINLLAADMTAGCWYSGPIITDGCFRMGFNSERPGKSDIERHEGWVVPRGCDLAPLLTQKNVKLKCFGLMTYPAPPPSMVSARHSPAESHPPGFMEYSELIITFDDLVIMPSEVTRMEREYPELTVKETEQPKMPAISEEKLLGGKAIAAYLKYSEATIKKLSGKVGSPVHKSKGGRLFAYPSELDLWQSGEYKKKEK